MQSLESFKLLPVTCRYLNTISRLFSAEPCSMYTDCSISASTSSKICIVSAQVRIFSCRSCILERNRNQDFGSGSSSNAFKLLISFSWKFMIPGGAEQTFHVKELGYIKLFIYIYTVINAFSKFKSSWFN